MRNIYLTTSRYSIDSKKSSMAICMFFYYFFLGGGGGGGGPPPPPPPPSGFDTTVFAKFVKKLIRELVRGEGMESFTLKKL